MFAENSGRIKKNELAVFVLSALITVYSRNEQGLRYGINFIIFLLWSKAEFNNLHKYIELLVIFSAVPCIVQAFSGIDRVYGISISPTQMSCLLFTCECYLIVYLLNKGFNSRTFIASCLCVILTFLTKSRSTFLGCIAVFAVYVMLAKKLSPAKLFLCSVLFIAVLAAFINSESLNIGRVNPEASNLTRQRIYSFLLADTFKDVKSMLFGNGGGYAKEALSRLFNTLYYYPAHQDYIMLFNEYGIIGTTAIYAVLFRKHKASLFFMLVFSVCSFHNFLLSPALIALTTLEMCDIENKNFDLLNIKRIKRKKTRR